jgi:hypothetical protein
MVFLSHSKEEGSRGRLRSWGVEIWRQTGLDTDRVREGTLEGLRLRVAILGHRPLALTRGEGSGGRPTMKIDRLEFQMTAPLLVVLLNDQVKGWMATLQRERSSSDRLRICNRRPTQTRHKK